MLIRREPIPGEEDGQKRKYEDENSLPLYNLIEYLKEKDFFPDDPNDGLWLVHFKDEEIGSYNLKQGYRCRTVTSINAGDEGEICFYYCPDKEERAEILFRSHCGNKKDMYYGGHMSEYLEYQVPATTEEKWRQDLAAEGKYQFFDEREHIREAHSFLTAIMKRPGMYVGRNRLELAQIYFDGWCRHQQSLWSLSYDLKQWLFLRESVVGTCSLNGWFVFYRTYGMADEAIIQFREFLETREPTSVFEYGAWDTASEDADLSGFLSLPRTGPAPDLKPYLDFTNDKTITKEAAAAEILRQVKRIVGKDCKKIKVFMNLGQAVEQVRFFFDHGSGWKDGVSLNTSLDYYEKMIVLHGYIKQLPFEKSITFTATIDWEEGILQIRYNKYQLPGVRIDDDLFTDYLISRQFEEWKLRELA